MNSIRNNAHYTALALVLAVATTAQSQTPLGTGFTYQGQLRDGGSPANGSHDFRFRLFDQAAGGAPVGSPVCADNVSVTDGLFMVPLDFGAQFAGGQRFLEIGVRANTGLDCNNLAGIDVLVPRQALTGTPNALFSLNAATAVTATNATQLTGQPPAFYQNASNLNAGTLDAARLPMPLTLSGSSATHVIRGQNSSTGSDATGIYGLATAVTGYTYGVWGQSTSTDGTAVFGYSTATTGSTMGVYGRNHSTSGIGVIGQAWAATGVTTGVLGQSDSTSGRGVYGFAPAGSGTTYGVYGRSVSNAGVGVLGEAPSTTGFTIGVKGESSSQVGVGVYGLAAFSGSGENSGVYGESVSELGRGVFGKATGTNVTYGGRFESSSLSGRGVFGQVTSTSGQAYGVLGVATAPAYAVYASGNSGTSGTKAFRIDHPDDPANKYLHHYSAEGPEAINFYRGTVTLDGAGDAVVELPHYFAKINKTPSYQLTPVGAPMPMLHIAEEINEAALSDGAKADPGDAAPACSFRIAGGKPSARVSWEVKALRNDKWVQKCGAPVEVEKEGVEKGTYQHPELYGQPPEKGMNYDAARDRPATAAAGKATPQ